MWEVFMRMSGTVRKMAAVMMASGLIISVAGFVFSLFQPLIHPFNFTLGVLLTTGLNIVKAVWLERVVERAVAMENQDAAANLIRVQYLLRFLFTGLVLVFAALVPVVDLWGAVAGIFTFHAAKYYLMFKVKLDDSDLS
jgi:predicted outer membrane lipoprotein